MARPRSQMKRNIREIERAIHSLESTMQHVFTLKLSYEDHKDYQIKTFGRINNHTEKTLEAIEMIASSCGQSITLLQLIIKDIYEPEQE